jgi:hypothetical protein
VDVLLLQELGALSLAAHECARLGRRYLDCLPAPFRNAGDGDWAIYEREPEQYIEIHRYFYSFYETTFHRALMLVEPSLARLDLELTQVVRVMLKIGDDIRYLHPERQRRYGMIEEAVSALEKAATILRDDLGRRFPGKAPADARTLLGLIRDIPGDPRKTRRRLMNTFDVLERFGLGAGLGWDPLLNKTRPWPPDDLGGATKVEASQNASLQGATTKSEPATNHEAEPHEPPASGHEGPSARPPKPFRSLPPTRQTCLWLLWMRGESLTAPEAFGMLQEIPGAPRFNDRSISKAMTDLKNYGYVDMIGKKKGRGSEGYSLTEKAATTLNGEAQNSPEWAKRP